MKPIMKLTRQDADFSNCKCCGATPELINQIGLGSEYTNYTHTQSISICDKCLKNFHSVFTRFYNEVEQIKQNEDRQIFVNTEEIRIVIKTKDEKNQAIKIG